MNVEGVKVITADGQVTKTPVTVLCASVRLQQETTWHTPSLPFPSLPSSPLSSPSLSSLPSLPPPSLSSLSLSTSEPYHGACPETYLVLHSRNQEISLCHGCKKPPDRGRWCLLSRLPPPIQGEGEGCSLSIPRTHWCILKHVCSEKLAFGINPMSIGIAKEFHIPPFLNHWEELLTNVVMWHRWGGKYYYMYTSVVAVPLS